MKKIYLTVTLFGIGCMAFAQPTITMANSAPMPGESFLMHFAAWQSEGPSGANQTWDFSNLVADSSKTFNWVDPANTPNGASFPTADIAQEDPGAGFVYYDHSNGDLEYVGADANGLLVEQSDPEVTLELPCTFGTTWTDTQAGTIPFGGTRAGTTNGDGDAYGTLTLPWGTVNNVLRVHLNQVYTDNIIITIDYIMNFYMYYKEGTSSPLLIVADLLITPSFGAPINTKYIQYADQSVVGIGEEMEIVGSMNIYPVPATEEANVHFTLEEKENITIDLIDMTGRSISSEELGIVLPGEHVHGINVADLRSGMYFIQLSSPNGRSVERLIVE